MRKMFCVSTVLLCTALMLIAFLPTSPAMAAPRKPGKGKPSQAIMPFAENRSAGTCSIDCNSNGTTDYVVPADNLLACACLCSDACDQPCTATSEGGGEMYCDVNMN